MPLDSRLKAFLDELATSGVPPVNETTPEEARAMMDARAAPMFGPADPVGAVVDRALPGPGGPIRVRIYEPSGCAPPLPLLVWFHGGGWAVGSLDSHDRLCRTLASRAGSVVVSVDYRLAPEHRFPAAVDDAWAATAWVAEHAASIGGDPGRIAVGGDSAGGNLAAVVAIRARDRGLPLRLQLLVYPVTDYDLDRPSYRRLSDGYWLTREAMRWYFEQYLGPEGDASHPEVSPLRQERLAGVCPAYVVVAGFDPLSDEGEAYADRLRREGVPVTLARYDDVIHGFYRMAAVTGRALEAIDASAAALRAALG